jgi:hypothetical protein
VGVQFESFYDFEEKFRMLRNDSDIFGFLLFDDRPSHRAVEIFSHENFPWIDRLATATKMFFFVWFRRSWIVENPGLEIAQLFGITPRELPAVVLLTLDSTKTNVASGIYLPLDAVLFESERPHIEEVFAEIFSVIQQCREKDQHLLVPCLEREIARIRAQERRRPYWQYLHSTASTIKSFPTELIKAVAEAFAKGMTRTITGGE